MSFAGLALVALLVAGGERSESPEKLYVLLVGGHRFTVELADTPERRRRGLGGRDSLPAGQGMLFVFPRDQSLSFVMRDMRIALSIAFISADGVIEEIHDMEPVAQAGARSSGPVRYALEVNKGAFAEAGIQVGDRVDLSAIPGDDR